MKVTIGLPRARVSSNTSPLARPLVRGGAHAWPSTHRQHAAAGAQHAGKPRLLWVPSCTHAHARTHSLVVDHSEVSFDGQRAAALPHVPVGHACGHHHLRRVNNLWQRWQRGFSAAEGMRGGRGSECVCAVRAAPPKQHLGHQVWSTRSGVCCAEPPHIGCASSPPPPAHLLRARLLFRDLNPRLNLLSQAAHGQHSQPCQPSSQPAVVQQGRGGAAG